MLAKRRHAKQDFKLTTFSLYHYLQTHRKNANILFNVLRNAETYLFQSKATHSAAADKLAVLRA